MAQLARSSTKESFGKQGKVRRIWERKGQRDRKVSLERAGTWNETSLNVSVGGNLRDTPWKEPSSTSVAKRESADSVLELSKPGKVEEMV